MGATQRWQPTFQAERTSVNPEERGAAARSKSSHATGVAGIAWGEQWPGCPRDAGGRGGGVCLEATVENKSISGVLGTSQAFH